MMKTITEYTPLIFARIAARQSRRKAAAARVQRWLDVAVERVMLPLIVLLVALLAVAAIGEGMLLVFHLVAP